MKLKKLSVCQNSKMVMKNEKFYKLGMKDFTPPPFWDGKTWVTRFIARRDYASTIIGAANDLKASMNEWDKTNIENNLPQKKKTFRNLALPDIGGIWKRMVQGCKKVMIAILEKPKPHRRGTTMLLVEQTFNAWQQ